MNWYLLFYLMSVSEKLSGVFSVSAIMSSLGVIAFLITWICSMVDAYDDEDKEKLKPLLMWAKRLVLMTFTFGVLYALIPKKADYLLIIGGGAVGQYVSNSEEIKGLPDDVVKYLKSELHKAQEENKEEE